MAGELWIAPFGSGLAANIPENYPADTDFAFYLATDTGQLHVAQKPTSGTAAVWKGLGGGSPVVLADAATATISAANSGRVHVVPDLTADCAIALPTAAKGLVYEFIYGGIAADAQDWNISTGADANYLLGGLSYVDDAPAANSVNPDGNSNSIVNVLTPEPGTRIILTCDGTNWYLAGWVASANAPTFGDQP